MVLEVWLIKHLMHMLPWLFQITHKIYPKLKEVDDVLGGAAAWENVDNTEGEQFSYSIL